MLNAYVYYTTNDVIKAGEALENINTSYLSDSAKQTYDTLNGSIADSYKEALYSQAYSSYSSGDYQSAIPTFRSLSAWMRHTGMFSCILPGAVVQEVR